MLKNRMVRRLLGGVAVTAGMLSMALPANAGTVSGTDPSGDALDPVLTFNDSVKFFTAAPAMDITSYSLTSNPTARTLTATFTVAGTIPAENSTDPLGLSGPRAAATNSGGVNTGQEYPGFSQGASYKMAYADTRTDINSYNLTPACQKIDGLTVIYDYKGHWVDGFRHVIGVSVNWDGAKWNYTPTLEDFDPTEQGGYSFWDVANDPAMAGKWSISRPAANSISVTIRTDLTISDNLCQGGIATYDYGRAGDLIQSVTALTTADQVVVLPVAIPLSEIGEGDIQAVGGLVSTEDWAPQAGYGLGTAGPHSFTGPTCPTPTFGGTLPRNPLHVNGQPCTIANPLPGGGGGFKSSGVSFTY